MLTTNAASASATELSRDYIFDRSNQNLLALLPRDQLSRVFDQDMCDIDESFLGFVDIYERLSEIIPLHWTVVDLGCAYSPQAFFFRSHKEYIGVDFGVKERFGAANARHLEMRISEFVEQHASLLNKEQTFAICSYVPPWHNDNLELARLHFKNVFTFYPSGDRAPILNSVRDVS